MSESYDIKKLLAEGVQPFADLSPEKLAELKANIEEVGMLEPVKLTADGSMLWDGHQRLVVLLDLGRKRIGAKDVRRVKGVTRANAEERAVATNAIRRQLTPPDMAQAMHRLASRGWDQTRIGKAFGKSQGRVSQLMNEFPPAEGTPISPTTDMANGKKYTRPVRAGKAKKDYTPVGEGAWSEPKEKREPVHPWSHGGEFGKALRKVWSGMKGWSPDTVHQELTPREWSEMVTLINEMIDAATHWVQEPTK